MPVVETFFGYVETTKDSLLLLEACRQGVLPRVRRRLQEQERPLVKSGAVFCFDENESGIKRWTDGLVWSPSRILGNFLIYRELDDKKNTADDDGNDDHQGNNSNNHSQQIITSGLTLVSKRQRERSLVGSLRNSYRFKPGGLIKKSMSIVVNGVHQHLVSYYNRDHIVANKFQTPSDIPELAMLDISSELLDGQNFRIPFFISPTDANSNNNNTALSGDKRTTTVDKSSTLERPSKQKKRSSSYVKVLNNSSPSPRRYSNSKNNDSLNSSPRHSNINCSSSSSTSSSSNENPMPLLQPPSTPSSLISTTTNYSSDSMQDDLPTSTSSTYHHPHHPHPHFASYSQRQPRHLVSPLTELSDGIFFSSSSSSYVTDPHHPQHVTPENRSMAHHHLSPQQQQRSALGSNTLDTNEGRQPFMAAYNRGTLTTTTTTTTSAGMVSDPISSPNNAYYQHQQYHHHSSNSTTSTPPTSYGIGSDAHHQQWAPHSFSTGYSNERYDQNPHQHLFSSTSFHAINHAALPTRTPELVSNGFMLDTNALLGSGWNDFEMQM